MPNINIGETDKSVFADQQFISISYNGKLNTIEGVTPPLLNYRVTFIANNKTYYIIDVGENQKISAPQVNPTSTVEGYTFKEWQLNGSAFNFNTVIESNIELVAKFEEQPQPAHEGIIFEKDLTFTYNEMMESYAAPVTDNIIDQIDLNKQYGIIVDGLLHKGDGNSYFVLKDNSEDMEAMGFTKAYQLYEYYPDSQYESLYPMVALVEPEFAGQIATMTGIPEGTKSVFQMDDLEMFEEFDISIPHKITIIDIDKFNTGLYTWNGSDTNIKDFSENNIYNHWVAEAPSYNIEDYIDAVMLVGDELIMAYKLIPADIQLSTENNSVNIKISRYGQTWVKIFKNVDGKADGIYFTRDDYSYSHHWGDFTYSLTLLN